ncbi:MAG: hypothetical protein P1P71_04315 [Anaerosomatales bacterium]|nr:hypothetical protein [Anaerosomatales bacterium]
MTEKQSERGSPAIVLLIIAATAAMMIGVGTRNLDLHFTIGPWNLHHWLSWFGATFIALFTPAFYVLKRRSRESREALLPWHVFGGLIAAAAVSAHFIQHVTRPAEFYPDLGTGIVLYTALAISVLTGVLMRHRLLSGAMREWRALHVGATVTFYLAIVMHVLTGLGVL